MTFSNRVFISRPAETWNEAAYAAALSVRYDGIKLTYPMLLGFEQLYNKKDVFAIAYLAHQLICIAEGRDHTETETVLREVARLVVSKQRDYGPEALDRHGKDGIMVRLWDKIARYKNLVSSGQEANYESIQDTLVDIIGYCVLWAMFDNGGFWLQMEPA